MLVQGNSNEEEQHIQARYSSVAHNVQAVVRTLGMLAQHNTHTAERRLLLSALQELQEIV